MQLNTERSAAHTQPGIALVRVDAHDVPDHAVRLPGGEWNVWRDFVLRGTGFPVSLVGALSAQAASAAADRYAEGNGAVIRCREAALQEVSRAFAATSPSARHTLWARRHRIFKGTAEPGLSKQEDALASAIAARTSAYDAYVTAFEGAEAAADEQIASIVSDPRFREAGIWQNHRSVALVTDALAEGAGRRFRRAREYVAMQIQRYAAKNDSIGFFGPIGWGSFSDRPTIVDVAHAAALIDRREVYFEGWCIDALVDTFNEGPARQWAAPRRATGVWTDGRHVYAPAIGAVPTTFFERRVLRLCDGYRTATEIVRAVAGTSAGASSEADVLAVLDGLVRRELVVWRIEVPSQPHPERELQSRLAGVADAPTRSQCEAALGELVAARDRVALAAGRPDDLAAALRELDSVFVRRTHREPSRRAGKTYAGRGLVYEDCRRAGKVTIGSAFLDCIGPPLSIVLDGARWACGELAASARQHLRHCHAELRERQGAGVVDGALFFDRLLQTPPVSVASLVKGVEERVQAAWRSILPLELEARHVTQPVDDVARRAREVFRGSHELWTRAMYMSPDVLVASSSAADLRHGHFHCVLGEVHCTNSLIWSSLASQHPDRDALAQAVARDADGRTLVFTQVPKASWLARAAIAIHPPAAWQYEFAPDLPNRSACRSAPAGMFVAVDNGRTVVMRARDASLEFDGIDLVGTMLTLQANAMLERWIPSVSHLPRITIGALTIVRERWNVRRSTMLFLRQAGANQFAAIRAWARDRRMPHRVFYKSPDETKPCYLDFTSPIYTALFAKLMRRLPDEAVVRIEEMLPDITDAWLADINGARYTSELRIAALVPRW